MNMNYGIGLHIMSRTLTSSLGMVFASSTDSRDRKGPIIFNTLAFSQCIFGGHFWSAVEAKKRV